MEIDNKWYMNDQSMKETVSLVYLKIWLLILLIVFTDCYQSSLVAFAKSDFIVNLN